MLPQDPYILLSFVNTKLRDEYESLESLCAALDFSPALLSGILAVLEIKGMIYHDQGKIFIAVDR